VLIDIQQITVTVWWENPVLHDRHIPQPLDSI
jgi:hypothetical protein